MTSSKDEIMAIAESNDIVRVRQAVRVRAIEAGLGLVDQTKIVTAASELARNALEYGLGGTARMETFTGPTRRGVRLTFQDQGPGIPDLDRALTDGFTTGVGMGLGLSGARRLSDEFDIHSVVGEGTRITIARWK
jgi:serine/threonine-protein kinase RsbT